ncbi:hypothetical protein [Bacillus sp. SM2101]|uniref:AAA family ATPase n=1 Tax=Bacillus sp. SM2101 TaxID=2805366 RepID=UPI001BDEE20F|nr:hypothetical protein [Bacillus sp. SM2101]
MKVAIYSENNILLQVLESISFINEVVSIESLDELSNQKLKIKAVLMDQNGITSPDLLAFREKHPKIKVVMMCDTDDAFFKKACITHSMIPIDVTEDESTIKSIIESEWFKVELRSSYKNVIAVHGTHRQVGVTQTTLSIARIMREYNYSVCVVGLNPYNPGEIADVTNQYSLDYIYPSLQNNVLKSFEELKAYMNDVDGFDYIIGNRDFYRAPEFEGEPIKLLIDSVKDHYDVVLLDCGSHYDNFLPITGLQLADTHLLVASQEFIATNEYNRWKSQILSTLQLKPTHSHLIINKYASNATITAKQLQDELEVSYLGEIPFFPEAADAQIESGYLGNVEFKPYKNAVISISKALIGEVKEQQQVNKKNKRKLFSGLFGATIK